MPHITIEYSANLLAHHDIDALVGAVHAAAADHGLAPLDGLRTRAVARDHFRIATGDPAFGFVAIGCRIGSGRDAESKRSFIAQVLDAAEARIALESGPLAIAWSIELTEIDPEFRINRNHVRTAMRSVGDDPTENT
jgi:5-carboxymethyl-2-hydroxymuconate isomerase